MPVTLRDFIRIVGDGFFLPDFCEVQVEFV